MGTTAQKLSYVRETKKQILEKVNNIDGAVTDNTTFRQGMQKVVDVYNYYNNASETVTPITKADKAEYLQETKRTYKEAINLFNEGITDNTPFREYIDKLTNIYNALPKVTGTGTEVTLENTKTGKMVIQPKGNTSQETTEGKNLCPTNLLPITANGLTISKDANGNIIINGTPNYSSGYKSFTIGESVSIPADKYSISLDTKVQGIGFKSGIAYGDMSMADTNNTKTTTLPVDGIIVPVVNIRYDVGTLENYILNPQIEIGTPTDYEPYTGGQPAPNPDYPQPIHVVTGNNTIGVTGKNILDTTLFNNNSSCTIVDKTNGKLQLQGKSTYYAGIFLEKQLKPTTQYTIQAKVTQIGTKSRGEIFIANSDYPQTGSVPQSSVRLATSNVLTETGDLLCTFTTDLTGIVNVFFDCNHDTTVGTITYENIQLEEGQVQTSFEPYTHTDYPINLGSLELCKIGDYQDYLYKENGNWYKYGNPRKVSIADIAQYFNNITSYQNNFNASNGIISLRIPAAKIQELDIKESTNVFCTHFKEYTQDNIWNKVNSLNNFGWVDGFVINMHYSKLDMPEWSTTYSITALRQALLQNYANMIFFFIEKNPATTQITDETLIAQLDAIEKAKSNEGQTNIAQTNTDLPFIINATALLKND